MRRIEDVEAVKDQLSCGELMSFPDTFEEFAEQYGFTDKKEYYSNGIEFIPVFRVKQWLEHISSVTPQEPRTGQWIKYCRPRCGEQHYQCTSCDEYFNFGLYSDYYKKAFKFCPNCGARMVEPQESEVEE